MTKHLLWCSVFAASSWCKLKIKTCKTWASQQKIGPSYLNKALALFQKFLSNSFDLMKKSSELLHKNRTVVKPDKAAMAGNFSTACLLFFSTHYGNSASCEVFIGGIQNFQFQFLILKHLFFLKWCPTLEN